MCSATPETVFIITWTRTTFIYWSCILHLFTVCMQQLCQRPSCTAVFTGITGWQQSSSALHSLPNCSHCAVRPCWSCWTSYYNVLLLLQPVSCNTVNMPPTTVFIKMNTDHLPQLALVSCDFSCDRTSTTCWGSASRIQSTMILPSESIFQPRPTGESSWTSATWACVHIYAW